MRSWLLIITLIVSCKQKSSEQIAVLKPIIITDSVTHDSDDPAIWYNGKNPSQSLVLGTNKFETAGSLQVFDLNGVIIYDKTIDSLDRPNNVVVMSDFILGNDTTDLAIVTERMTSKLRIFTLPDMKPVDAGGIPVFSDEPKHNAVMGIGVYRRPSDGQQFAILSRKSAPTDTAYLHQYRLYAASETSSSTSSHSKPIIRAEWVRSFGHFSGKFEIEAIAVDQEAGYVYYSDEGYGIRKYHADPQKGNKELAVFGKEFFVEDREGIAIIHIHSLKGYIVVSDQQGGQLHFYNRLGSEQSPHLHNLVAEINFQAKETDGIEVIEDSLNSTFPDGLLVAMSDDKTFHYYDLRDVLELIGL